MNDREERAIEALIALALRPVLFPPTDSEIDQFLHEYAAGKYPLTIEDEAALETARNKFMRELRQIYQRPNAVGVVEPTQAKS